MYVPQSYAMTASGVLEAFVVKHSFATMVSIVDGAPFATHIPVLFEPRDGAHGILHGHMARANPHWKAFEGAQESLVIFHGPHGYISPRWYAASLAVPTWNYAVVHMYGKPQVIDDATLLEALIDRTVRQYESGFTNSWDGELPREFKDKLMKAIVGFTMDITRVEGKFKLGQNRSSEDQARVLEQLAQSDDPGAGALGELMREMHLAVRDASQST
ncbi:MAG: putative transcriptional regulator [Candidatus Hydrogenedentota bacterium]